MVLCLLGDCHLGTPSASGLPLPERSMGQREVADRPASVSMVTQQANLVFWGCPRENMDSRARLMLGLWWGRGDASQQAAFIPSQTAGAHLA